MLNTKTAHWRGRAEFAVLVLMTVLIALGLLS